MDPLADSLPLAERMAELLERLIADPRPDTPLEGRAEYTELAALAQQAQQMLEQGLAAVKKDATAKAAEIRAEGEKIRAQRAAPPPPPEPPMLALEFEQAHAPAADEVQSIFAELAMLLPPLESEGSEETAPRTP